MGEKGYASELEEEKYKNLKEQLAVHDQRLNDHGNRLKKIEQRNAAADEKIENLCDQIKDLVVTLRWGIGVLGTSFLGMFVYLMELHLK